MSKPEFRVKEIYSLSIVCSVTGKVLHTFTFNDTHNTFTFNDTRTEEEEKERGRILLDFMNKSREGWSSEKGWLADAESEDHCDSNKGN